MNKKKQYLGIAEQYELSHKLTNDSGRLGKAAWVWAAIGVLAIIAIIYSVVQAGSSDCPQRVREVQAETLISLACPETVNHEV